MTMREQIARALWDSRESTLPERGRLSFDQASYVARRYIMADADAVLKAMREPIDAMTDAYWDTVRLHGGNVASEVYPLGFQVWEAMVDAAIAERAEA